jgi:hypothetical protein
LLSCAALGALFGGATSVINDAASPYGVIGAQLARTVWSWLAEFASLVLDSGWAWAALGVAAGWLAGRWALAAVAGVVAQAAASVLYYLADSGFQAAPYSWGELRFWLVASVLLGAPLGAVGAAARQLGLVGLLAGLVVPVGAALQMVVLPPRAESPAAAATEVAVWVAAVLTAVALVLRWRGGPDFRRPNRPWA